MGRGAHRDGFPDYRDTNNGQGRHQRQFISPTGSAPPPESRNAAFLSGHQSASMGRAAEREWGGQTNTESAPGYIFGGRY